MPGNLIVNGSLSGAAGFTGWSSTATVADLQVPHSGNALKMSAGQSNPGRKQEIRITQGRTYRMGVWAKQDPGTTIKDAGNTSFVLWPTGWSAQTTDRLVLAGNW